MVALVVQGKAGPKAGLFSILSTTSTEKSTYWQLQVEKCGCSQSRDTVKSSPWHMTPIHSAREYLILAVVTVSSAKNKKVN